MTPVEDVTEYQDLWSELSHQADGVGDFEVPIAAEGPIPIRESAGGRYQRWFLEGTVPLAVFTCCAAVLGFLDVPVRLMMVLGLFLGVGLASATRALLPNNPGRRPLLVFLVGLLAAGWSEASGTLLSWRVWNDFGRDDVLTTVVEELDRCLHSFLSLNHLMTYLVCGLVLSLVMARVEKRAYWFDQKPPSTARRVLCFATFAVLPLALWGGLLWSTRWTEPQRAWLAQVAPYGFTIEPDHEEGVFWEATLSWISLNRPHRQSEGKLAPTEAMVRGTEKKLYRLLRTAQITSNLDRRGLRSLFRDLDSLGELLSDSNRLRSAYLKWLAFSRSRPHKLEELAQDFYLVSLASLPKDRSELEARKRYLARLQGSLRSPLEEFDAAVLAKLREASYQTSNRGYGEGRPFQILGRELRGSPSMLDKRATDKRLLDIWLQARAALLGLPEDKQLEALRAQIPRYANWNDRDYQVRVLENIEAQAQSHRLRPYLETAEVLLELQDRYLQTGEFPSELTPEQQERWRLSVGSAFYRLTDTELRANLSNRNKWVGEL